MAAHPWRGRAGSWGWGETNRIPALLCLPHVSPCLGLAAPAVTFSRGSWEAGGNPPEPGAAPAPPPPWGPGRSAGSPGGEWVEPQPCYPGAAARQLTLSVFRPVIKLSCGRSEEGSQRNASGAGFLFGGRLLVNSVLIPADAVGRSEPVPRPGLSNRRPARFVSAACLQDGPGGWGFPSPRSFAPAWAPALLPPRDCCRAHGTFRCSTALVPVCLPETGLQLQGESSHS